MKITEKKLRTVAKAMAESPKKSKVEVEFTLRRWDAATPIAFVSDNPHREGTFAYKLREATKRAATVGAFIALAAAVDVGKASKPGDFLKEWGRRGLVKIGRGRKTHNGH